MRSVLRRSSSLHRSRRGPHSEGPPQNLNQPLLTDEQVFATHSDFIFATLVRDRASRHQHFKRVAHSHGTLSAAPNEVG